MKDFKINDLNISKCFLLLKDFFNNEENLASVAYPKSILFGGEEWFYYIFYSCLLDYGMRSKVYHQNLILTYELFPNIFHPKYVVDNYINNTEELLTILKENVHPRYPNVSLKKWIELSLELSKYNNLKDKILSFESFNELTIFIRNIKGYGQKTGGLLLRLIYDSKVCGFSDDLGAIPLDRHDIEICYLNGIINKSKLSEKEISLLSTSLIECGKKLGLSPSIVDKYLWEAGNRFCNKKSCLNCPLNRTCKTKID